MIRQPRSLNRLLKVAIAWSGSGIRAAIKARIERDRTLVMALQLADLVAPEYPWGYEVSNFLRAEVERELGRQP